LHRPIIENETINFRNLYFFLSFIVGKYIKVVFFFIFIYMVYFFGIKEDKYSASVSFYTDYSELSSSTSLSILKSFQGQDSSKLSFSISNYINSEKFLESVILHQYSLNKSQKNLIEIWNISGKNSFFDKLSFISVIEESEKQMILAKQRLKNGTSFQEDRKTGLNTISVKTKISPDITEQIVQQMFNSILGYSNEITSVKAREKVSFIEGRVNDIKLKLEFSENEMLSFVENNKNLNSPHLVLKKNRIQRDIDLLSQVFRTLSDQLEVAKIDEMDNTSSIVILDSSRYSPFKPGRGMFENIYILVFLLFGIFFVFESFNNRKNIFL
jgi:hypothetical protein